MQTRTQRKDRAREENTLLEAEKHEGEVGDKERRQKRLVSKNVAYPNSFQRLQNLKSGWSVVDYLISTGVKAEEENGTTGERKWEILPWMRAHFPQKSRPFALLSRSSPSNRIWSLLLCAPGAPQQTVVLSAWRRHGSAWTGVRACACTRGLLYQHYFHTPAEEDAKAQLEFWKDAPSPWCLKPTTRLWFLVGIKTYDNFIGATLSWTHATTLGTQ